MISCRAQIAPSADDRDLDIKTNRESINQIMFETLNVSAMYVCIQTDLSWDAQRASSWTLARPCRILFPSTKGMRCLAQPFAFFGLTRSCIPL